MYYNIYMCGYKNIYYNKYTIINVIYYNKYKYTEIYCYHAHYSCIFVATNFVNNM